LGQGIRHPQTQEKCQRQPHVYAGRRQNLQLIYHLVKERGFTLDGAKTHLKEGQKKTLDKFEIINKLEGIKAQLLSIKAEL
jgi:hypothetical protein